MRLVRSTERWSGVHLRQAPHPIPSHPILSHPTRGSPGGRASAYRDEQLLAISVESRAHWKFHTTPGGGGGHAVVTSQNRGQDNENERHLRKGAFLSSKCPRGKDVVGSWGSYLGCGFRGVPAKKTCPSQTA